MTSAIAPVAVLALLFLVVACGREEKKTVHSADGETVEVTTTSEDQLAEMRITTKEGTATVKLGDHAAPEGLGLPTYPGAEAADSGSFSASETKGTTEQSFTMTSQFTRDPIDRVAAYYKGELQDQSPQVFEMTTPQGRMVNFLVEQEGTTTTIVLVENKEREGTNIQISRAAD